MPQRPAPRSGRESLRLDLPGEPLVPRPPVRGEGPTSAPEDRGPVATPFAGTRFRVTIDGRDIAVARVSAPHLPADRESLRLESPGERQPLVWSGDPAGGAVVLERAFDGDTTFYAWRRSAATHDVEAQHAATRDVHVTVLDDAGAQVATMLLHRSWPVRWTGPALAANEAHVAVESLELVYADLLMR